MRVTLCLLTFNELEGCRHDVPQINRKAFDEIYAIDGGSKDGTIEYLESQGVPVHIQPKRGLNAACVHAFSKCTTDALVFFHPKGTVPVADAERFRSYFEQGYQLVVASRNIAGAHNEEDEKYIRPRKWMVKALALAAALVWRKEGPIVWDVLHGFRGATVSAFNAIALLDKGLSVDIEMVVRSYKKRLRRVEFPTHESTRIHGETHFKMLPTGKKLLNYLRFELTRAD